MIEIRPDQMVIFEERDRSVFVGRSMSYLRDVHGTVVKEMSDEDLRNLILRQITAAAGYGIKTEAAVVQFIEIGLAWGEDFHSSFRFPTAERILASDRDGTSKMRDLMAAAQQGFTSEQ